MLVPGKPLIPATEDTSTTDAPAVIRGKAFCTVNTTPFTLVSKVVSKCSSVMSPSAITRPPPALATSTSRRPLRSAIVAKSASRDAMSDTAASTTFWRRPVT